LRKSFTGAAAILTRGVNTYIVWRAPTGLVLVSAKKDSSRRISSQPSTQPATIATARTADRKTGQNVRRYDLHRSNASMINQKKSQPATIDSCETLESTARTETKPSAPPKISSQPSAQPTTIGPPVNRRRSNPAMELAQSHVLNSSRMSGKRSPKGLKKQRR